MTSHFFITLTVHDGFLMWLRSLIGSLYNFRIIAYLLYFYMGDKVLTSYVFHSLFDWLNKLAVLTLRFLTFNSVRLLVGSMGFFFLLKTSS